MTGHDQIINLRNRGYKPSTVFVHVSDHPARDLGLEAGFLPSVSLSESEAWSPIDLRFLVACRVCLNVNNEDTFVQLMNRLVEAGANPIFGCCTSTWDLLIYEDGNWRAYAGQDELELAA